MPFYKALATGFITGAGEVLTMSERRLLPDAGFLITFEQAVRFLGDYLNGDVYYTVEHPEHNRDRARNQLRLASLLRKNRCAMAALGD